MSNILLAWELGEGLGHLTVLRPIAERLLQDGHRIHLASRDLTAAETVFGGLDVELYQAPVKLGKPIAPVATPMGYSQLLHNCGFETSREITGRLKAWDRLFDLVDPALVVCDHSPTVLAAARGRQMRVANVGTGFVNPPIGEVMPSLMPRQEVTQEMLSDVERDTLATTNVALEAVGKPALGRMSDLYARADCTLITSFKELDHFGERQGFRYSGAWPQFGGDQPEWPSPRPDASNGESLANPKRVFAYLKRSPGLTELLKRLGSCGHSVLVYGNWTTPDIREKLETPTMRLLDKPVDLSVTATQCDLAILNGTHGATAAVLLGGTPVLQLPIYLEQYLVAERVLRMGAGLAAERENVQQVMDSVERILGDERFTAGARRFAKTYRDVSPDRQFQSMMDRLNDLLAGDSIVSEVAAE